MKRKHLIASALGVMLLGFAALIFIHFSNDHLECDTVVKYSVGINGEKVKEVQHICKERFNL